MRVPSGCHIYDVDLQWDVAVVRPGVGRMIDSNVCDMHLAGFSKIWSTHRKAARLVKGWLIQSRVGERGLE